MSLSIYHQKASDKHKKLTPNFWSSAVLMSSFLPSSRLQSQNLCRITCSLVHRNASRPVTCAESAVRISMRTHEIQRNLMTVSPFFGVKFRTAAATKQILSELCDFAICRQYSPGGRCLKQSGQSKRRILKTSLYSLI
jgi:hypothetical protein